MSNVFAFPAARRDSDAAASGATSDTPVELSLDQAVELFSAAADGQEHAEALAAEVQRRVDSFLDDPCWRTTGEDQQLVFFAAQSLIRALKAQARSFGDYGSEVEIAGG